MIKQLRLESQKRDPEGVGINFIFDVQASASNGAATPLEYLNETTIKIDPPLRDLRLVDVLDAITKTASKPIRFTVEDYAVVFSPKPAAEAMLYTKVFKVDPNTFVQGLENVRSINLNPGTQSSGTGGGGGSSGGAAGTGVQIPGVQVSPSTQGDWTGLSDVTKTNNTGEAGALVKAYFTAAGVNLSDPGKVVFFNDRLGQIMVRASLKDLEVIEQAVELLNQSPPQLTIEAKFVEMNEASLQGLGFNWAKPGKEFSAIITDAQFRSALATIEQHTGFEALSTRKVTTLSGRQTHISSTNADSGVTLDILATVGPDGFTVQTTAIPTITPIPPPKNARIFASAVSTNLWDGQTLVIGRMTTNQLPKARKVWMVFVTLTIIDPAGNRVHTDEDMPFSRNSIPAQPPAAPQ